MDIRMGHVTWREPAFWPTNQSERSGDVEAKIEAYGLGSMMSQIKDENSILIPLDILNYIAKKSHVNTEDLIKSYITGLINGQKASKINNK